MILRTFSAAACVAGGYFFGEWYAWVFLGVALVVALTDRMADLLKERYRADYLILCLLNDGFGERASAAYKKWLLERPEEYHKEIVRFKESDAKRVLGIKANKEMRRIVKNWHHSRDSSSDIIDLVWGFKHGSTEENDVCNPQSP